MTLAQAIVFAGALAAHTCVAMATHCPGALGRPVLVIGGGISGIAAASELKRQGCAVKVVEAKDHLGGRTFGEVQEDGWVFNIGANWIHGASPNPIWDFNEKHKVVRTQWLPRTYYTRTKNGVQRDYGNDTYVPGLAIREDFRKFAMEHQHFLDWLAFACRGEFNALDLPLTYFMQEYLSSRNITGVRLDKFLLFYGAYMTLDIAVDLYSASMMNEFGRSYNMDKEHMLADPYNNFVDFLAQDLDVIFNEPIRTIEYSEAGVVATSRSGRVHEGALAIVTIPIGVLKTADVSFLPPLPPWKQRAIASMNMGLLEKVALVFEEPWWENAGAEEDAFWTMKTGQRNGFKNTASEWYNLHNLLNKTVPPVLLTTPSGYFADLLEYKSDAEVIQLFRQELQSIFPHVTVPEPRRFLRTFHRQDEFMRGSYFSPSVGTDPLSMNYLAEAVANRLLFAGEATSTVRFGFVDGAYETGLRAAKQAVDLLSENGGLRPFDASGLATSLPPDVDRIRREWRSQVEDSLNITIPHCGSEALLI